MKYLKIAITLIFVAVAVTFLSQPNVYMQSFLDGITVWAYNVLPALFPFAVLSALAVKFFPNNISVCKRLFGVKCDDIYLVSLLCGYPLGAKAIAESNLDNETATRVCAFCSSASPVFIAATVGVKLLQHTTATLILVITHLLSTVLNGLMYRKKTSFESNLEKSFTAGDIGNSLTSAVLSVLSVGGLIALFYMLSDIIKSYMPSPLSENLAINFTLGLFEMTNGIISVCATCNVFTATVLSSFLLAFGGMCVFAQSITFLAAKNVKPLRFLQIKFTQGSIATVLSFILGLIFL